VSKHWKVVIVGGGFGGLRAAQNLRSDLVDVTLVDRRNYHLFQPLLYQVATGSLSAGEIASPLRGILSGQKNTRVLLGTVVDVDPESKQVTLQDGAVLQYDSLIVATGSQTSYFGHNEWRAWALGLKSIEVMTTIRHQLRYSLEVAERMADRIGVIADGRLIAQGTLDELRRQAGKGGTSLEETFLTLVAQERVTA